MRRPLAAITVAIAVVVVGPAVASAAGTKNLGSSGGFVYVKASDAAPATSDFATPAPTAKCPGRSEPTGGGAVINTDPRESALVSIGNNDEDGEWGATAWSFGVERKTTATAYAVCTKKPKRLSLNGGGVTEGGTGARTATAFCSEDQGFASGGILNLAGDPRNRYATSFYPNLAARGERGDSWTFDWFRRDAATSSMGFAVICLDQKGIAYKDKAERGRGPTAAKVFCPGSKSVVGGGFVNQAAGGSASRSMPIDSKKDADRVPDDGWLAEIWDPGQRTTTSRVWVACA